MIKRKMMFNYPFFAFKNRNYPYKYYNYPIYQDKYNTSKQLLLNKKLEKPVGTEAGATLELNKYNYSSKNHKFSKTENLDNTTFTNNEHFFSILGIKLYFDDLIILALLFCLYNEGVKDEGLFICLILLLLS